VSYWLTTLPLPPALQENELFVGRVAQLGFAASLIGEIVTGKGPLAQLGLETGVPLYEIEGALAAWILFLFFAAINPGSGKFINNGDDA
jgi:photosystem II protein